MTDDSKQAKPIEPRKFKAASPRKPIKELDERGKKLCELMAWGAEPDEAAKHGFKAYDPLRLEEAAKIVGLKLRNARFIFAQPVFLREFGAALDQLRLGYRARAISTLAGVMEHEGANLAADRAVRTKAATALLGDTAGGSTNVQIGVQTGGDGQPLRAGVVIRLRHGTSPPAPLELEAVADEAEPQPAAGPRYGLSTCPETAQQRYIEIAEDEKES